LAGQVVARLGAPGILALQEIQDESGERDDGTTDAAGTLRALAEAIRRAGGPEYRYFDVAPADGRQGGARGGNIRNAFLYRPDRVSLVSFESLTPDRLADVPGADTGAFRDSRDPLAGVFDGPGGRIIVINNHLSSRYGSTPAFGAVQPFVQAGEASRAAQVGALRAYVARRLAQDSSARIVVLGDMNTFEFTDDLALLLPGRPPILHSLMARVPAAERYSYNYEGNSQLLDHVFVTGALLAGAELDIVHLNVDFPSSPGATASDHDPLVARFR
jgi:predicted extracellular nuclease